MIDFDAPPINSVIEILLRDMNSGGNILFNGKELTKKFLPKIKPRALKSADEKILRTRTNAEVFTPSRVVKFMVDALDDGGQIDSRWLEIACGEAPFLTNRYDAETGEEIPINQRVGILDRKLRNAKNLDEAKRAVKSIYGYELQGDSLLIARANILLTFAECIENFSESDLAEVAEIIAWNLFQFDGTKEPQPLFGEEIIDWRIGRKFVFGGNTMKKFDFVIGNPPYHEENSGDNKNFSSPVYNILMEQAQKVGEKVTLITPARFLFDAGGTPKDFNKRMLSDTHLKVLKYEPTASESFKNVEIKGGVAITIRDESKNYGAIGTFIPHKELNSTHQKVCVDNENFQSLSKIVFGRTKYFLTKKFIEEHPDAPFLDRKNDFFKSNVFKYAADYFFDEKPNDGHEYIQVCGVENNNERATKFIRRDYIAISDNNLNFYKYKVLIPEANGSGNLYEVLSTPLVGSPLVGSTQTFISVGAFDTQAEAEACLAYIKGKFCRAMLGILKVTQHNPPQTWAKVPLQDFTADSDIDWTLPIPEIDKQLYKKYGLDDAEINFIETHVKAMA